MRVLVGQRVRRVGRAGWCSSRARAVAMASVSKFDFEFGAWTDARGAWDEDDIPDDSRRFL